MFITVELNKYHIIQLQETGVPLNMMSFNIKGNKVCHEDVDVGWVILLYYIMLILICYIILLYYIVILLYYIMLCYIVMLL